MATTHVDAGDLLTLLESTDICVAEEIETLIQKNLQTSKEGWLLNGLVDSYMKSQSERCMHILAAVQEPHDKHLLERLSDHLRGQNRLQALTLFAFIVRKQPSWLYKVAHHSLMTTLTKCLKMDNDVPVLMSGVLIITSLMPIIPVAIVHHLPDIFEAFSRLVSFNLRKPGNMPDVYLLHLQVGVYALFHRLYGMYPCNFLTYLRSTYTKPDNRPVFDQVLKPMLDRVRMHPLLVTASKDKETAMDRWRHKEVHDIMVDCAKLSLDPIEGWREELLCPVVALNASRYQTNFKEMASPMPSLPANEPQMPAITDSQDVGKAALQSQDPFWSPSAVCGLSTPPPQSVATSAPDLYLVQGISASTICAMQHVDSPLPLEDSEKKHLSLLNTQLVAQMHCFEGPSVPPSPLKPDFTSEPPPSAQRMNAIRKIDFDAPPREVLSQSSEVKGQSSEDGSQSAEVTPGEEAKEDISVVAADISVKTESEAAGGSGSANKNLSSTAVPSVSELSQFIDSLDVQQDHEDQLADEDKEVSELTQDGTTQDDSTSESDIGTPSHIPSSVQMTAESVADFMKQVNRIRFNSMNVTRDPLPKVRQYSRSSSCPDLKEPSRSRHGSKEENIEEIEGDTKPSSPSGGEGSPEPGVVDPPVSSGNTQKTIKTTIQTQTSMTVTVSSGQTGSDVHDGGKESAPEPENELDVFYRYLLTVLQPQECVKCKARETEAAAELQNSTESMLAVPGTLKSPLSPGAAPSYAIMSPPELLDRHILIGGEVHEQELTKIPLTSHGTISWTHFGGVPPADEVSILRGQLLLLHNQLMFERHKRELHAKRNRRLLGRTVKTTAIEEQNTAMQDQLRLQEREIQNLSESLAQQQCLVADLKQSNDKFTCDRQVQHKSHLLEVEKLNNDKKNLESQLLAQKEENNRLGDELQKVRAQMFCVEQQLQALQKQVGPAKELQEQATRLTKELLLMGELQQKYQQRLVAMSNSHNPKPEMQFILDSYKAELAALRLCLDQKGTLLESTRSRLTEAEEHLKQKEATIVESKKLIEDLQARHKGELQATEEKYRAQKKIQQAMQAQILDLSGQLAQALGPSAEPEGAAAERRSSDPNISPCEAVGHTSSKYDEPDLEFPFDEARLSPHQGGMSRISAYGMSAFQTYQRGYSIDSSRAGTSSEYEYTGRRLSDPSPPTGHH